MREFLAKYCERNNDKINHDLFDRKFDRPLVEFVLDSIRNLEALPAIKLDSWEYITDQTKIRTTINKRLNKDARIKNNKTLERLLPLNGTLSDLLVLHFTLSHKGRTEKITRRMLIPKELHGHYYIIGGKKVTLINQIVDNSTFVKGDTLKFKTIQFPVDICLKPKTMQAIDGSPKTMKMFQMSLFGKDSNPLTYFLAEYGVMDTIEMFALQDVMAITYRRIDNDRYRYYRICKGLYLEVNRAAMKKHEFIPRFVATLYDAMTGDPNMEPKDALDGNYWLGKLSELFTNRKQIQRGKKALISFSRILDPTTKKRLHLRKFHKKNSHTLVRWLLTNFDDLMRKDNHDLRYKRIRGNECIAYFFDSYITRNVYSLLNSNNASFDRHKKLLNAIHETALLRSGRSGSAKGSTHSIYRYEHFNDFDAINACRHSLKGPNGLNGGKNGTSIRYKDIYVSHLGRLDLNVCSASAPGMTGYLTANCQLDPNGYFDPEYNEPDTYDPVIDALLESVAEPGYRNSRSKMLWDEKDKDSNGFLILTPRMTAQEINEELNKDPNKYGLFRIGKELHLIHTPENVNTKGFIELERREDSEDGYERDANGFIILERTVKVGRGKK